MIIDETSTQDHVEMVTDEKIAEVCVENNLEVSNVDCIGDSNVVSIMRADLPFKSTNFMPDNKFGTMEEEAVQILIGDSAVQLLDMVPSRMDQVVIQTILVDFAVIRTSHATHDFLVQQVDVVSFSVHQNVAATEDFIATVEVPITWGNLVSRITEFMLLASVNAPNEVSEIVFKCTKVFDIGNTVSTIIHEDQNFGDCLGESVYDGTKHSDGYTTQQLSYVVVRRMAVGTKFNVKDDYAVTFSLCFDPGILPTVRAYLKIKRQVQGTTVGIINVTLVVCKLIVELGSALLVCFQLPTLGQQVLVLMSSSISSMVLVLLDSQNCDKVFVTLSSHTKVLLIEGFIVQDHILLTQSYMETLTLCHTHTALPISKWSQLMNMFQVGSTLLIAIRVLTRHVITTSHRSYITITVMVSINDIISNQGLGLLLWFLASLSSPTSQVFVMYESSILLSAAVELMAKNDFPITWYHKFIWRNQTTSMHYLLGASYIHFWFAYFDSKIPSARFEHSLVCNVQLLRTKQESFSTSIYIMSVASFFCLYGWMLLPTSTLYCPWRTIDSDETYGLLPLYVQWLTIHNSGLSDVPFFSKFSASSSGQSAKWVITRQFYLNQHLTQPLVNKGTMCDVVGMSTWQV